MGPLRVLMVTEDLPAQIAGGLGRHLITLGNALIRAGHEVVLLGRDQPRAEDCREEMGFDGPVVAGFPNPWVPWFEQRLGVFNPAKRPVFARRIARAILQHARDFDVVHYHGHLPMVANHLPAELNFIQTRHDQGSECIMLTRFRNGQVCRALQDRDCAGCAHERPGPLRSWISERTVRHYRQSIGQAFERHPVVFVSEFLRSNYRRAMPGVDLSLTSVVHNFVDEDQLRRLRGAAPPAAAAGDGSPRVIHLAGRLHPSKGVVAFLERLLPMLPAGWQVRVFGDGEEAGQLQEWARQGRVDWRGHRPVEEVLRSLVQASVCVVPSVWEEPCGTVVLEALRLGLRCHVLERGGNPELLRYARPGQLRLHPDLEALVDDLLGDPPDAARMPSETSADVQARLPELLYLYRQGMARTGWRRQTARA